VGHLSLKTIGFSQSDQVKILFSPDKLPAPYSTCIKAIAQAVFNAWVTHAADDVTLQLKVEVTAVSSYP